MKKTLSILALAMLVFASCGKEEEQSKDLPKTTVIKGMTCVLIPAGEFNMGSQDESAPDDEKPQHKVKLTKSYYLSETEVTHAQYCEFLNALKIEPVYVEDGNGFLNVPRAVYKTKEYGEQILAQEYTSGGVCYSNGLWYVDDYWANRPVINVSWYGANEYCRWAGGQLPTEAQWEYACRAGTDTKYFWGDNEDGFTEYVWCKSNTFALKEVGTNKANPWGLYDILGNVHEMCSDWYDSEYYASSKTTNPQQTTKKECCVIRGGSWTSPLSYCSDRERTLPEFQNGSWALGFRFCYVP